MLLLSRGMAIVSGVTAPAELGLRLVLLVSRFVELVSNLVLSLIFAFIVVVSLVRYPLSLAVRPLLVWALVVSFGATLAAPVSLL
jgi:hypothetical protein